MESISYVVMKAESLTHKKLEIERPETERGLLEF
jgi:hypothetical protein